MMSFVPQIVFPMVVAAGLAISHLALAHPKQDRKAEQLDPLSADRLQYDQCLALIRRSPDRAINFSLAWRMDRTNNIAARHCEALALAADQEYAESAGRLEKIAADLEYGKGLPLVERGTEASVNPYFISEVWAQAANAWLLAEDLDRAEAAIDRALAFVDPRTISAAPYLIDRAHIAAKVGDYDLAYDDLFKVLSADPQRRDILVLLASAARARESYNEAHSYLDTYEISYPKDPALYLERGYLYEIDNKIEDAQKSWLKVLDLEENGPTADAARANLQRLALKPSQQQKQPEAKKPKN